MKNIKSLKWYIWLTIIITITRFTLFLFYAPWNEEVERTQVIYGNPGQYHIGALNIIQQKIYSIIPAPYTCPDNFLAPGYSFLVACTYSVFGIHPWVVLLLQILLQIIACIIMYKICKLMSNEGVAKICSILFAFCPTLMICSQMFMPATSFFLLFILFLLYWIFYTIRSSWLFLCISAFFLGAAMWIKPAATYMPIVIAFLLIIDGIIKKTYKYIIVKIALFSLIFGLVLLPWFIRNYKVMGEWDFATSTGETLLYNAASIVQQEHKVDRNTAIRSLVQVLHRKYDQTALPAEVRRYVHESWVYTGTNLPWVSGLISDKRFQTSNPRIPIRTKKEDCAAKKELFVSFVSDNFPSWLRYTLINNLRMLFYAPWEWFLGMTLPEVEFRPLAIAIIHCDIKTLSEIGWLNVAIASSIIGFLTLFSVGLTLSAFCGFILMMIREKNKLAGISLLIILFYYLAIIGPLFGSRWRIFLLPELLPLSAYFLWTIKFNRFFSFGKPKQRM